MAHSHLQAYNILDMKVTGLTLRTVSTIYTTTVGNTDAWGGERPGGEEQQEREEFMVKDQLHTMPAHTPVALSGRE